LRHRVLVLLSLALSATCGPCVAHRGRVETQERNVVVAPPPAAAAGTHLQLRVTVGPLPADARILVLLCSGELVGAITPFGVEARGGVYFLPFEHAWLDQGRATLRLRVETDTPRGTTVRAPSAAEVSRVEVVTVP
jgi:hypothetical protein